MKNLLYAMLIFGCLISSTPADSPSTTQKFYDWYLQVGDDYRERFSEAEDLFSPELYSLLQRGFSRTPESGWFVDFDPFVNAQVGAASFSVGQPQDFDNDMQWVKVTPYLRMGEEGSTVPMPTLKVFLSYDQGTYKITNIAYPGEPEAGMAPWNLRGYLNDGLATESYQGEDPSTMLAIEEVIPGTWLWSGTAQSAGGPLTPPAKKTIYVFDADGSAVSRSDSTEFGVWTSGEGHFEWKLEDGETVTFKVEKFGESEMTLKHLKSGDFWVLKKI